MLSSLSFIYLRLAYIINVPSLVTYICLVWTFVDIINSGLYDSLAIRYTSIYLCTPVSISPHPQKNYCCCFVLVRQVINTRERQLFPTTRICIITYSWSVSFIENSRGTVGGKQQFYCRHFSGFFFVVHPFSPTFFWLLYDNSSLTGICWHHYFIIIPDMPF